MGGMLADGRRFWGAAAAVGCSAAGRVVAGPPVCAMDDGPARNAAARPRCMYGYLVASLVHSFFASLFMPADRRDRSVELEMLSGHARVGTVGGCRPLDHSSKHIRPRGKFKRSNTHRSVSSASPHDAPLHAALMCVYTTRRECTTQRGICACSHPCLESQAALPPPPRFRTQRVGSCADSYAPARFGPRVSPCLHRSILHRLVARVPSSRLPPPPP